MQAAQLYMRMWAALFDPGQVGGLDPTTEIEAKTRIPMILRLLKNRHLSLCDSFSIVLAGSRSNAWKLPVRRIPISPLVFLQNGCLATRAILPHRISPKPYRAKATMRGLLRRRRT